RNSMLGAGNASTLLQISWCLSGARCIATWRGSFQDLRADEQFAPAAKTRSRSYSMHRSGVELVLDALEVIEAFDGLVQLGAFLLAELSLHLGDSVGKPGPIQLLE